MTIRIADVERCRPRHGLLARTMQAGVKNITLNIVDICFPKPEKGQGSWPWFILISKRSESGDLKMLCGATLIDHYHALSAAHCFVTDDFASGVGYIPPEKFVFQINRYTSRLKEVKYLQPEWIRCHENYIQGKECGT